MTQMEVAEKRPMGVDYEACDWGFAYFPLQTNVFVYHRSKYFSLKCYFYTNKFLHKFVLAHTF